MNSAVKIIGRRRNTSLAGPAAVLAAMAAVGVVVAAWWSAPRPIDVLFHEGMTAVERDDAAAARRLVRELRGRGADAAAGTVESRLLLTRGLIQPALDGLAAVDATKADDTVRRASVLILAEAAQRMGRHVDVEAILAPLLTQDPDDVAAHRLLAASYYDVGAIDPAIHHLRETARLAPTDHRPHRLLGLIHNDYEQYDDAIRDYEESLRRSPDQSSRDDVLLELAACKSKTLRHLEALATLDRTARSTGADILRAECLVALGRVDEARRLVDGALADTPDHLGGLVLRGTILLEDGRAEEAAETLERAARDHPHDYLARMKLSQALLRAGRGDDAERERHVAETIRARRQEFAELHREAWARPGDEAVRLRLASVADELGRPDLADVWRAAAAAVKATVSKESGSR